MVLKNKPLEKMLEEIQYDGNCTYDIIIPKKNGRVYSKKFYGGRGYVGAPKELMDGILEIIEDFMGEDDHVKNWSAPIEIIENAFVRGNNYQADMAVSFKVFEGEEGLVLRIRDSGKGFDYKKKINQFHNGEEYWQNLGWGLKDANRSSHVFSYEGNGSIVNIMMKKQ